MWNINTSFVLRVASFYLELSVFNKILSKSGRYLHIQSKACLVASLLLNHWICQFSFRNNTDSYETGTFLHERTSTLLYLVRWVERRRRNRRKNRGSAPWNIKDHDAQKTTDYLESYHVANSTHMEHKEKSTSEFPKPHVTGHLP